MRSLGGNPASPTSTAKQIGTPASLVESSVQVQQDRSIPHGTSTGYTEGRLVALSEEEQPIYMEE